MLIVTLGHSLYICNSLFKTRGKLKNIFPIISVSLRNGDVEIIFVAIVRMGNNLWNSREIIGQRGQICVDPFRTGIVDMQYTSFCLPFPPSKKKMLLSLTVI